MHLVVTKVELKPNTLPAFQEVFESRVPEFLGQASSWRGAEVSIDRETNTALVVGYWEDADQMREVLTSPEHAEVIQEVYLEEFADDTPTERIYGRAAFRFQRDRSSAASFRS